MNSKELFEILEKSDNKNLMKIDKENNSVEFLMSKSKKNIHENIKNTQVLKNLFVLDSKPFIQALKDTKTFRSNEKYEHFENVIFKYSYKENIIRITGTNSAKVIYTEISKDNFTTNVKRNVSAYININAVKVLEELKIDDPIYIIGDKYDNIKMFSIANILFNNVVIDKEPFELESIIEYVKENIIYSNLITPKEQKSLKKYIEDCFELEKKEQIPTISIVKNNKITLHSFMKDESKTYQFEAKTFEENRFDIGFDLRYLNDALDIFKSYNKDILIEMSSPCKPILLHVDNKHVAILPFLLKNYNL